MELSLFRAQFLPNKRRAEDAVEKAVISIRVVQDHIIRRPIFLRQVQNATAFTRMPMHSAMVSVAVS